MKLGPVTKIDKRNKTQIKKIDDDVMSKNYDVIVVFPIYFIKLRFFNTALTYCFE